MMIKKLTQDLIGKRVSCKIHGTFTEGVIGYYKGVYYIAQNIISGYSAPERYGFSTTWGIEGENVYDNPNGVKDLKLLIIEPNYEIY